MKPAIVTCAFALVLVLTAVASAAAPPSGSATGTGLVFVTNPVQSLGNESLTDQKDADSAVPLAAYHEVQLTNLDGSGFLRGDYVDVVSETGKAAYSAMNSFRYSRHQDEFEQVMAYYWVTEAQKYIRSLGFGVTRRAIGNGPLRVRINQFGQDNSFETDHPRNELRFGKGGVDDAEDAEVILHEYGHAIHDAQNFSFATEEAGAISEGFGDYWAVTVGDVVAKRLGVPVLEPLACVADWDAVSYTSDVPHCLRRVDESLHYPGDLDGKVHDDGQIWSRALWDIRGALGNVRADTVILQAQFDFDGSSMPTLARSTVATARSLYGNAAANAVRAAFENRGVLP
jgi:zinc metalloprotease ZmpB